MKKRFNIASNKTNKIFYIIAAFILFLALIIQIYALTTGLVSPINPGHNATQVFIRSGQGYITLQDAIDYGFFSKTNSSPIAVKPLPTNTPYEFASQVLMTVSGYNITLQDFTDYNLFASPSSSVNYAKGATVPAGGEYASRININTTQGIMSLQSAINTNINLLTSVLYTPGTSCYPSGVDVACTNPGTIQSDGITCSGYTTKPFGTQSTCSDATACDGSGHCFGYSGTGWNSCPFGTVSGSDSPGGVTHTYYFCKVQYFYRPSNFGGQWYYYYGRWYAPSNMAVLGKSYSAGWTAWNSTQTTSTTGAYAGYTYLCNCNPLGSDCQTCTGDTYSWQMKPYMLGPTAK